MAVTDVKQLADITSAAATGAPVVLHFWASWSEPCKHMDTVLAALASDNPGLKVLRVEAEVLDEATIKYDVTTVPTFVFLKGGEVAGRLEGADPAALADQVSRLAAAAAAAAAAAGTQQAGIAAAQAATAMDSEQSLEGRIKFLLSSHPVVLFMKGSSEQPRCGFSSRVVDALRELQVPFKDVDILADEGLRAAVKAYGNWPTYPQLYVKGELIGGCDIVTEMKASGDLSALFTEKLGPDYRTAKPEAASAPAPAAAPSAAAAPAVPPAAAAGGSAEALQERLKALVKQEPVMLFMKGTPEQPRCGFSRKVSEALQGLSIPFGSFDILSDESVRQGLKEFSSWPTYPQLYVQGELLGGCDIVLQLKEEGELKSTVEEMMHRMDTV